MINVARLSACGSPWLIGKDKEGRWVVRDQSGMHGGIFIDRTEALRFALSENGRRPQAVVMVPEILELDTSVRRRTASPHTVMNLQRV